MFVSEFWIYVCTVHFIQWMMKRRRKSQFITSCVYGRRLKPHRSRTRNIDGCDNFVRTNKRTNERECRLINWQLNWCWCLWTYNMWHILWHICTKPNYTPIPALSGGMTRERERESRRKNFWKKMLEKNLFILKKWMVRN